MAVHFAGPQDALREGVVVHKVGKHLRLEGEASVDVVDVVPLACIITKPLFNGMERGDRLKSCWTIR